MKLLGENAWDDDAEWVKENVGDIHRYYHYRRFEDKDGIIMKEIRIYKFY